MPRPVKCRKVCHFPNVLEFLPADDTEKKTPIVLTVDELRQEKSTELKNIMDDYYREYIDKSLSGVTDLDFTLLFELMNLVQSSPSKDNKKALEKVFKKYHPQIVINAAAHKHVPLMEENPCEAVLVNVTGSRQVADMAVEYGAEKMIMVSTDKAVNPTNVMGCSKRLAEIYVQSLGCAIREGKIKGHTKFITTRFGNVLGSNGSVIPRFKEQIENGGPVTVTHPDIIRFFII